MKPSKNSPKALKLTQLSILIGCLMFPKAQATTWALNYSGEWNDDSRNTELGLLNSSVFEFRPAPSTDQLEIRATTQDTHGNPVSKWYVHFDLDVGQAGFSNASGIDPDALDYWRDVTVTSAVNTNPSVVVFDTLDAFNIVMNGVAHGSNAMQVPTRNIYKRYALNQLTLDNVTLEVDNLHMQFFDSRPSYDAKVTFKNSTLDLSNAGAFGTLATQGAPLPMSFISDSGDNTLILDTPNGSFTTAGLVTVDINDGTSFRILNTGATDFGGTYEMSRYGYTSSGKTPTYWTVNVGSPGGSGATFTVENSLIKMDGGYINLYDNSIYEVKTSGSSAEVFTLNVEGDNAQHNLNLNTYSYPHDINVNADNFQINLNQGYLRSLITFKEGQDDFSINGTTAQGKHTYLQFFNKGSTDANDPQTLTFANTDQRIRAEFTFEKNNEVIVDSGYLKVNGMTLMPSAETTRFVLNDGAYLTFDDSVQVYNHSTQTQPITISVPTYSGGTIPKIDFEGQFDLGYYNFDVGNSGIGNNSSPLEINLGQALGSNQPGVYSAGQNVLIPGRNTVTRLGAFTDLYIGNYVVNNNWLYSIQEFGALTLEGSLITDTLSSLHFDVGLESGVYKNDVIQYGDAEVTAQPNEYSSIIVPSTSIIVSAKGITDARELHNKQFTLMKRTPGTTGYLRLGPVVASSSGIQSGATMPAAIKLTVIESPSDSADHGRFTIGTEVDHAHILSHASTHRNHRNQLVGLVNAGTNTQLLNSLTVGQVGLMGATHAEPYSSYQTLGFEQSDLMFSMVRQRSGVLSNTNRLDSRLTMQPMTLAQLNDTSTLFNQGMLQSYKQWANVNYVEGEVDARSDLSGFKYDLMGAVGGMEMHRSDDYSWGVFTGFSQAKLSEHSAINQTLNGQTFTTGVYASNNLNDDWSLASDLGYSVTRTHSKRSVPDVNTLVGGTYEADFTTQTMTLGAKLSRMINASERMTFIPTLGANYSYLHQGDIDESGSGDLGVAVDSTTADSLVLTLGFSGIYRLKENWSQWSLMGNASFYKDVLDSDQEHTVNVSNTTLGSYEQFGANRGSEGTEASLGMFRDLKDTMRLGFQVGHVFDEFGSENSYTVYWAQRW